LPRTPEEGSAHLLVSYGKAFGLIWNILPRMDTREILAAVKAEVSRLNKVVALLEGGAATTTSPTPAASSTAPKKKPHKWTAAEKKAMSIKQKALWAAKKKQKKV